LLYLALWVLSSLASPRAQEALWVLSLLALLSPKKKLVARVVVVAQEALQLSLLSLLSLLAVLVQKYKY
jgi:hypothetical protein